MKKRTNDDVKQYKAVLVYSLHFLDNMLNAPFKTFVQWNQYRLLEKRYIALYKRYKREKNKTSNKHKCPKCNDGILVSLSSLNQKMCSTCRTEFDWKLKAGQKSILIDNLTGTNYE